MPHAPAHDAVALADGVRGPRRSDGQRGEPCALVRRLRVHAAELEQLIRAEAEVFDESSEHRDDLVATVDLVAGGHRRVGREGEVGAGGLQRAGQLAPELCPAVALPRRGGDGGQRSMALVEVEEPGLDPHGIEGTHRTGAEQRVLPEADRAVALVEPGGDPALDRRIVGQLCVEEVERHPAHLDPPDVRGQLVVPDRKLDSERGAVSLGDAHRRHHVRVGVHPVLMLPARAVHALVEVATAVEEAHADVGDALVRGLLEQVAGEDAEAARVDGQRAVDAELGAEEGDAVDVARIGSARHRRGDHVHALEELLIGRGVEQHRLREVAQEANGVLVGQREAVGAQGPEELVAPRRPGPGVVIGDARQRLESLGKPSGQAIDGPVEISAAVVAGGGRAGRGGHHLFQPSSLVTRLSRRTRR